MGKFCRQCRALRAGTVFQPLPLLLALCILIMPLLSLGEQRAKAGRTASQSAPEQRQIADLIAKSEYSEAESRLFAVLTKEPQPAWALRLLAALRVKQARLSEAESLFKRVIAVDSRDVEAHVELGSVLKAEGKRDDAIAEYQQVRRLRPRDMASAASLAKLYSESGAFRESLEVAQEIPIAQQPVSLLPAIASDYFGLKQPEKVQPLIPRVLRGSSREMKSLLDFSQVLAENGYIADAAHLLEAVRPPEPSADYLGALARLRQIQGKNEIAEQLYQQALALAPGSYDLLFNTAHFYADHGQWAKAVDLLGRADELYPDRPELLKKLTLSLLKLGRVEAAVQVAQRLNILLPNDPDSEHMLAVGLVLEDGWEAAEPIAKKLSSSRPNDASAQLVMASVLFQKGDNNGAREYLRKTLELDANVPEAHFYLGQIAQREGNIQLAKTEMEKVVAAQPDQPGGQFELGKIELQLGELQAAKGHLERASQLAPTVSINHYQLAVLYTRLGMKDQAKGEMDEYQRLKTIEDNKRHISDKAIDAATEKARNQR